jgi:hypothetical protein
MPRIKLQNEIQLKSKKQEPIASFSFDDLPDWFGRKTLKAFLRCSDLSVMVLLNKPVREGGIPCRKIGNQYRIIKQEFGKAWGFITETIMNDNQITDKVEES